jgi:hypothetical protein
MHRIGQIIGICAPIGAAGPAHAAKKYHCLDDHFNYTYKLGKSQTKEFKEYCQYEKPENMGCSSSSSLVSCDHSVPVGFYITCSCTNWSATGTHKAKIHIGCD